MTFDAYDVALTVIGVSAVAAAWIPSYLDRRPLSLPILLVGFGALVFLLPLPLGDPDPREHLGLVEHATELGVLISLMGAGLKIDRPFGWRTWATTWRMLLVAMPLTIAFTALAGAVIGGLAGASALLLGSVIAPTDPVLASDVQVGEPTLGEPVDEMAEEDVRFTLTSEAGLNDALAFPFVFAAIAVAEHGWAPSDWLGEWLVWHVVGRIALGVAGGWIVGRLLAKVAFRPPGRLSALAASRQGFVAIAAVLCAYGLTEMVGGYGFLAVFVAAVTLRSVERDHEFHGDLHGFADQAEQLLMVGMLLFFGGALVSGIFSGLTWGGAAVALLVVFVIRPLSGQLALVGSSLRATQRWVICFFGIRGFGTVYYLAVATGAAAFPDVPELWAIAALTLVVSVAIHGITATPMMRRVDREGRRWRRRPSARVP